MKLLDLFCGIGGASHGYALAGFDVTGVDRYPQDGYPYKFIRADALEYLADHIQEYTVIHASPPCQQFSKATPWTTRMSFPNYIPELRRMFHSYNKAYVIENVEGSPLINPMVLCGTMFGMRLIRHRLFESNLPLGAPEHPRHTGSVANGDYVTVAGHGANNKKGNNGINVWKEVMEIPWAKYREDLAEAIPPRYTEYLGNQLMEWLVD